MPIREDLRRKARTLRRSLRARAVAYALRTASGWTIAAVVTLVLALTIGQWPIYVLLGVLLLLSLGLWAWERIRYEVSAIHEVDALSPAEFERWVGWFLEDLGFEIERTPYFGDFGADLVASWNGVRTAVQVKQSRSQRVGVRAVQEVVAAKSFYGCERAMVITNNFFTGQARKLARSNGVHLRTRDHLAGKLARSGKRAAGIEPA